MDYKMFGYLLIILLDIYLLFDLFILTKLKILAKLDVKDIFLLIISITLKSIVVIVYKLSFIFLILFIIPTIVELSRSGISNKGIVRMHSNTNLMKWNYISYAELYIDKNLKIEYYDSNNNLLVYQNYNLDKYEDIVDILKNKNIALVKK